MFDFYFFQGPFFSWNVHLNCYAVEIRIYRRWRFCSSSILKESFIEGLRHFLDHAQLTVTFQALQLPKMTCIWELMYDVLRCIGAVCFGPKNVCIYLLMMWGGDVECLALFASADCDYDHTWMLQSHAVRVSEESFSIQTCFCIVFA
jgi:hypothetical protein